MSEIPDGCQAEATEWRGYRNWGCTLCNVATLDDRVRDANCQALDASSRSIAAARAAKPQGATMQASQDPDAHNEAYMSAQVADDPNTNPDAAEPRELGGGWFEITAGPRKGERVQGRAAAVEATEHPADTG